jgi:D-3-phosphoglycerate dehydrogenase
MAALDDVLARADILSMHLTLGEETRDFLNAERLARTKKGVIVVNTARGAVIEEQALLAGLRSGHIRHAALDVFHDEPLRGDEPLTKLQNVTLTAHAGFSTPDSLNTLMRRAIDLARDAAQRGH